uniref:Uncharacterized protein n=1 Tax=Solanum lycopersicum TaxID=4081 RepID=A0A3Q7E9B2_SOLLC
MECFSSLGWFCISNPSFIGLKSKKKYSLSRKCRSFNEVGSKCVSMSYTENESSGVSYKKLIHFALEETNTHTLLSPSPLQCGTLFVSAILEVGLKISHPYYIYEVGFANS